MPRLTKLLGILSIILFGIGSFLKLNHLAGGDVLLVTGLLIFVFGFSTLFLKSKLAEETRRDAKLSYAAFFFSSGLLMVAASLSILHLEGAATWIYCSLLSFMVYITFFSKSQDGRKLRIQKDRQLAAVVFTDIAGYTRMMGQNEDEGLRVLEQNRKIQEKWITRHRGKLLKEMGDGTIAIFYTATEAMLCALEIQKEVTALTTYSIRIGIHISEIVFTDKDAFGDGMNLASRISNQAKGGEIFFSDSVYQNIRNREKLPIEALGFTLLKNVDQPVLLYKIGELKS